MEKQLMPDFILIPYPLYRDKNLQGSDRLVYGVIYWLENLKDGYCWASNAKIAQVISITPRSVANSLERLEKQGYIERFYKDDVSKHRMEIKTRVSFKAFTGGTPYEKLMTGVGKVDDRGYEKLMNRVDNRKESNNKQSPAEPESFDLSKEIQKMVNDKQRHIQLIGEYLQEKKVKIGSKKELSVAIKRHVRDAVALAAFDDEKIGKATVQAMKEYPAYTLGTLVKILTR